MRLRSVAGAGAVVCLLLLLAGCSSDETAFADHPRLDPHANGVDVYFQSRALKRTMTYRVAYPKSTDWHQPLPVVYLLHGGGGDYRDWSNFSDVTQFASSGLLLVMPQGDYSYYVNAADPPGNRYEDYIVQDLISDVESGFPVVKGREGRAIIGVSMGGFGAMKIALSHPDLFVFAGALSPAIDVARRRFSFRRVQQSRALGAIFGPWNSAARRSNDPFSIIQSVNAPAAPYLFLTFKSRIRRRARGAPYSARVPRRRRRTRLEPVELTTCRRLCVAPQSSWADLNAV